MNRARTISTILAAWLLALGFDFLLHAGVLARLYMEPSTFLLSAELAFSRIPLGYLAFFILAAGLYWLLARLEVRDWLGGLRHGLLVGLVLWGAVSLGLYSISTATPELLLGWWLGQGAELGLSGAVIGSSLGGRSLKSIWLKVGVAVLLLTVATLLLQATGLAPAMTR